MLLNSDQPDPPDTEAYQNTTAVKNGNVVVVDTSHINQPAPRIVEPMKKPTKAMHPEAYERAKFGPPEDDSGETTPPPSFAVDVSPLNVSTVELYGTVSVTVNVTNSGGPGGFTARLYTNGGLRQTATVSVGPDETKTLTFRRTFSTLGNQSVRVNDHDLGTVRVVRERWTETPSTSDLGPANGTASQSSETSDVPTATEETPTATGSPTPTTATEPTPSTTVAETEQGSTETDSPSETPLDTRSPTERATGADTPTAVVGGQPGFGHVVALLALSLVGISAGRRRRAVRRRCGTRGLASVGHAGGLDVDRIRQGVGSRGPDDFT